MTCLDARHPCPGRFPLDQHLTFASPTLPGPSCLPDDSATPVETSPDDTLARPFRHPDVHTLCARLRLLKAGVEKDSGPIHCLLSRPTTQSASDRLTAQLLRTHSGGGPRPYHTSGSTSWQPEGYDDSGDDDGEEGEGDNQPSHHSRRPRESMRHARLLSGR